MSLHPKIIEIEESIRHRSKDARERYLKKIRYSSDQAESARGNMGCSNIAHAFASCDKAQQQSAANGSKVVGIITAYNDMLSAHEPLKDYPDILKDAAKENNAIARVAGGVPAMCDGVTQGEPGMELSLFSRDVIALSSAVGFSHNVFDAGLCLGVCDKIVPGLMIGSLTFGHMPIGFIPAGPMHTGISNDEKAETRKKFSAGEIDRGDLIASEQAAYHSSGTCTFYGTANTNQLIMEIMGVQLPSASFTPPDSPLRKKLTEKTLECVLDLSNKNLKLGEMLDSKSWVNAMVALLSSGGSTNLTIHLIAMAAAGGYEITLDDMNELSKVVPTLTSVYPSGKADVNEFHDAGGVAALIGSLLDGGFLFNEVSTILGDDLNVYRNIAEIKNGNLVWEQAAKIKDQSIIRDHQNPFHSSGGLKLMSGNIGEGIIKTSALKKQDMKINAPAEVFNNQEEVEEAFAKGDLNKDCIIVVKGQGPSANGMPELHKLTAPLGVLQSRGFEVAILTDGRMSGASGKVPAVIHVSPEAKELGPISLIENGDIIDINLSDNTFNNLTDSTELEKRTPSFIQGPTEGVGRELFNVFRNSVDDVKKGASIFNEY